MARRIVSMMIRGKIAEDRAEKGHHSYLGHQAERAGGTKIRNGPITGAALARAESRLMGWTGCFPGWASF
jgi:hypothetical protein